MLKRRVYRIEPKRHLGQLEVIAFQATPPGMPGDYYFFNHDALCFYLIPTLPNIDIKLHSTDFDIRPVSRLLSMLAILRSKLARRRESYLKYRDFTLISTGSPRSREAFLHVNRVMRRLGVALDGAVLRHPALVAGWAPDDSMKSARSGACQDHEIAIVVHIHYREIWRDIEPVLKRLPQNFKLIVTVTPDGAMAREAIAEGFPDADVHLFENRGRDVRPFMILLESGKLEKYKYICKIHGKKSEINGNASLLGMMWRRRMLFELLAAPGAFESAIDLFNANASIGMIGPRIFRRPNAIHTVQSSWGDNRQGVLNIASRMKLDVEELDLDYFCGTMFWVRTAALRPLRDLGLSSEFEPETGKRDGTLAHALERAFSKAVLASGHQLADVDHLEDGES